MSFTEGHQLSAGVEDSSCFDMKSTDCLTTSDWGKEIDFFLVLLNSICMLLLGRRSDISLSGLRGNLSSGNNLYISSIS